jgi:hypothetical protein
MKQFFLALLAVISIDAYTQNVGINNTDPQTSLDVNGSFRNRPTVINVVGNTATVPDNVSYALITCGQGAGNIVLNVSTSIPGRRLIVENRTCARPVEFNTPTNSYTIESGELQEFIMSPEQNSWVYFGRRNWPFGWSTTGNFGTNPTTDFIGTTDNQPLNIRVNNIPSGKITFTGSNTYLGYEAGLNNTSSNNVGIGRGALKAQTTGGNNIAIGLNALRLNVDGSSNLAIGSSALSTNVFGNYNTALGYNAGVNNTGEGNVFLGYQAGANELLDNKLYIENSNADQDNALIYGDFNSDLLKINGTTIVKNNLGLGVLGPSEKLDINGNLKLNGEIKPGGVSGTAGQVLQNNGNGTMSWTDKNQQAFSVFGTSSLLVTPFSSATLIPGLTQTITVPTGGVVYVSSVGGINTTSTSVNGFSVVDIKLYVDGVGVINGGFQRGIAMSFGIVSMIEYWNISSTLNLSPGSHTISITAAGLNFPGSVNATVSQGTGGPLQATLSVLILK